MRSARPKTVIDIALNFTAVTHRVAKTVAIDWLNYVFIIKSALVTPTAKINII